MAISNSPVLLSLIFLLLHAWKCKHGVSGELWWTRRICTRLCPVDKLLQLGLMSRHPNLFQQTTLFLHWKTAVSGAVTPRADMPAWHVLHWFFFSLVQWCCHTSAAPPIPQEASWQLWLLKTCWVVYRTQTCPVSSPSRSWNWTSVPTASSGAAWILEHNSEENDTNVELVRHAGVHVCVLV